VKNWLWLENYLNLRVDLPEIIRTFPNDPHMNAAVRFCHGMRLLRQPVWETLASFICSANKQIVQIRQIIGLLCQRFGTPVPVPQGHAPVFAFPGFQQLARVTEADLRACKMGFRAPHLLATARLMDSGGMDLDAIATMPCPLARQTLIQCPGVGPKIADCVLLFACGFEEAFPMDVWILRALRQLYFRGRQTPRARLEKFSHPHFGPHAGYAQQYLFHTIRTAQ
jgi:N-glycosylase/DNA lyase